MLKKILLILTLFTGLASFAQDNFLNSIIIDKNNNDTAIILRTDEIAGIKRKIESSDKVILTLKNVVKSPDLNTLYKNNASVSGIAVQDDRTNGLNIYIQAPDIAKANIIFETPDSSPVSVKTEANNQKSIWTMASILIFLLAVYSARKSSEKNAVKDINVINKEREKALYRNFQKEIALMPDTNYKLKSYKKYVLDGGTLRNYEKKSMLLK